MTERINTSGFTIYPECSVVLEVTAVTLQTKKDNPSVKFYRWDFTVRMSDNEDILNEINFLFFPNQMGDLLRAIGAKEISKDNFELADDWKRNFAQGKLIKANIVHTIFRGETKHTLSNIEPYFEETINNPMRGTNTEVAWDEESK